MKNENLKSTSQEDRVIYSTDVAAIQMFAEEHLNRKLSADELESFEYRFEDHFDTGYVYESACDCFDEIIGSQ